MEIILKRDYSLHNCKEVQLWGIKNGFDSIELILVEHITKETKEKGYAWLNCDYLIEQFPIFKIKSDTMYRKIVHLLNKNILIKLNDKEIVNILKNKNMKNIGIGDKVCNWCGCNTLKLHKHHYPISRKDGGTETVSICPNCHNEFHYNSFYRINLDNIYQSEVK